MWRSARGFTLVELMVVIAIISILASVGLTVYSSAQKNARISKRIQDLKAIEAALEIYYQAYNAYPTTSGSLSSECATGGSRAPDAVIPGLTPNYMTIFPSDPRMDAPNNTSCYIYISDAIDYKIYDFSVTEMTQADYQTQRALIDPARDGGLGDIITACDGVGSGSSVSSWAIYTSGARCW